MGVIDKLNALDEKVGIQQTQTPKSWARNARWWWVNLVCAVVSAVAVVVWELEGMAFFGVGAAFASGFFYNERLRLLGRRSRWRAYRTPE